MRAPLLLSLLVGRARALSALPAAARRLRELRRLEGEHARLVEARDKVAARAVRKELNALRRAAPGGDGVACRVATFYGFAPVAEPPAVAARLRARLEAEGDVVGTVSVAAEGFNGALAVAEGRDGLAEALHGGAPELWPTVGAAAACLNWDVEPVDGAPFHRLLVKAKKRALVDGFDEPLDWDDCGEALGAAAWDAELRGADATLLDVRNAYETAAGTFAGATPLDTATFVETWPKLDAALADKPKDEPVYMFCTGGIRCVKAGAYVKQKLGFEHVKRLDQGIVGYERWRDGEGGDSLFEGDNFVFDKRADPDAESPS